MAVVFDFPISDKSKKFWLDHQFTASTSWSKFKTAIKEEVIVSYSQISEDVLDQSIEETKKILDSKGESFVQLSRFAEYTKELDIVSIVMCFVKEKSQQKSNQYFLQATRYSEMGKTKKAITNYTKAGKYGHKDSDFAIGKLYFEKRDFQSALGFFAKGAQQGNFKCAQYFGWIVENNLGIATTFMDFSEAAQYHRKVAEMGCRESMAALGRLYLHGVGVVKNFQQAVKWLTKAAELEDAEASFSLGKLYERGNGVDKDIKECIKWYRLSSKLGNNYATFALRRLEVLGIEVKEKKIPPPVPVRDRSATVSSPSSPSLGSPPIRKLPPLPLTKKNNEMTVSNDKLQRNGVKVDFLNSDSNTPKKIVGTVRF